MSRDVVDALTAELTSKVEHVPACNEFCSGDSHWFHGDGE